MFYIYEYTNDINKMAFIKTDGHGTIRYYNSNGQLHRDDKDPITGLTLPAVEWADGMKYWYKHGLKHRDDKDEFGLTLHAVEYANGTKLWYKNDMHHRDDKDPITGLTLPAFISLSGTKIWYKNGQFHRDDKDEFGIPLPAIVWNNGVKRWCINRVEYLLIKI